MLTAVNNSNNNNTNSNILFLKEQHVHVRRVGKKDTVQRKLNQQISWQIFPTIIWNISISITHPILLIVLRNYFSTWIQFF